MRQFFVCTTKDQNQEAHAIILSNRSSPGILLRFAFFSALAKGALSIRCYLRTIRRLQWKWAEYIPDSEFEFPRRCFSLLIHCGSIWFPWMNWNNREIRGEKLDIVEVKRIPWQSLERLSNHPFVLKAHYLRSDEKGEKTNLLGAIFARTNWTSDIAFSWSSLIVCIFSRADFTEIRSELT